ncbi:hypothetical protein StoSoilB13_36440 (plasmid) [Arthrobacter sp. StoSoilB13]|nr:hypothetical protein StoSoilB13_36440 [Arthrobacter sp. StoSoilB13]
MGLSTAMLLRRWDGCLVQRDIEVQRGTEILQDADVLYGTSPGTSRRGIIECP